MDFLTVWNVLGIIAILLLFIFARGRSSVWGGLTLGVVVGLIIALVYVFKGDSFSWTAIKKSAIIGVFVGVFFEVIGRLSHRLKK